MGRPSPTRLCILCGRSGHDRCSSGKRTGPVEFIELTFRKSDHLTCSRSCWNVELAICSCSGGGILSGQDQALAGAPNELALSSISPLEKALLPAPLHSHISSSPASVDNASSFVEISVFASSTVSSPVFKVSSVQRLYRANTLIADRSAEGACLLDPN